MTIRKSILVTDIQRAINLDTLNEIARELSMIRDDLNNLESVNDEVFMCTVINLHVNNKTVYRVFSDKAVTKLGLDFHVDSEYPYSDIKSKEEFMLSRLEELRTKVSELEDKILSQPKVIDKERRVVFDVNS